MLEFLRLQPGQEERLAAYLRENEEETIEMTARLEKYGLVNNRMDKKAGDWYVSLTEGQVSGVFQFSNHRSFLCHYRDPEILKKVVLLKAIRQYAPRNISGVEGCVEPIYQLIRKSLRDIRYAEFWQMFGAGPGSEDSDRPMAGLEFVDARQYDLNRAVDFLIESEKAFGRKPKMVNDLKLRILDREDQETCLFLLDQGRVVAQGMVEYHTARYAQIGGVYTASDQRRKGYGTVLMRELMRRIREMDRIPSLAVEKRNSGAVALYEKLGFRKGPGCVTLDVELE